MMMRTVGLLFAVAACGNGGTGMTGDDVAGDDGPNPDAGIIEPPARGFQLVSPDIDIGPGVEVTYCWYFRTPNTGTLAINKWVSSMTPGSHHMIMFTTGTQDVKPVGTLSSQDCGFAGGATLPAWTYSAQTPDATLALPSDDGAGKPLGIEIPANTAGFLQMHYYNAGETMIKAHVTLNAEALDDGVAYTKTAAYVTYNSQISIPPNAIGHVESQTCNNAANLKFWLMSTHAHKQAVKTVVKDGTSAGTAIFTSDDWEHPQAKTWMTAPFYTFGSGKVTYECTYDNNGDNKNNTIKSGDSAATNEMCMASGYYFPATNPKFCVNGFSF